VNSIHSASKFALEATSQVLAGEVAQFNVRVVCVQPGVVLTPIFEKAPVVDEALLSSPFPSHRQLRRIGKIFESGLQKPAYPEDVAETVYHTQTPDDFKQEYLVGKDAEALGGMAASESKHLR
jgi:NAD(P)-dependent dehydrogenase (short-subunit alcohol dehydrogenase family)